MPSVYMLRFLLYIFVPSVRQYRYKLNSAWHFSVVNWLNCIICEMCRSLFFSFFFHKGTILVSVVFILSAQINFRAQLRLKRKERAISWDQGNSTLGAIYRFYTENIWTDKRKMRCRLRAQLFRWMSFNLNSKNDRLKLHCQSKMMENSSLSS